MGVGWGINSLSAIPQDYAYIPVNVVGEKVYMACVRRPSSTNTIAEMLLWIVFPSKHSGYTVCMPGSRLLRLTLSPAGSAAVWDTGSSQAPPRSLCCHRPC